MRKIYLSFLFIIINICLFAQSPSWNFGAEKGYAWLQGEVEPTSGFGFEFYVDKPFTSFLSIRLNVGMGLTQGMDKDGSTNWLNHSVWNGTRNATLNYSSATIDTVFNNFQTSYQEANLQAIFTFSQLKALNNQSPFDGFILGGIGLMRYSVAIDAANAESKIYDFSKIGEYSASDDFQKISNIRSLMDGTFETNVSENPQIAPLFQVGGGLSWKISKHMRLALSHRVAFLLTDELDSYQWNANNQLNNTNDIHHYTTIGIQYALIPKAKSSKIIEPIEPKEKVQPEPKPEPVIDTPDIVVDSPEILFEREKARLVVERVFDNLEFETNKAIIKNSSHQTLDELALVLKSNKTWKLRITGHTDNVGNAQANKELSRRRAEAVRDYLANQGVNITRFLVSWKGEEEPVADNNTAAGRQKNRRVELEIVF